MIQSNDEFLQRFVSETTQEAYTAEKEGSRHLSAQKITKETDALAVVVSEDGPITVFKEGEVVDRVLVDE